MIVDLTLNIAGAAREHVLRVEFDFELGAPARITGGPSSLSVAEYDCGERGAAAVRRAWVVREVNGKPIRERALRPETIMKLKEDEKLGELLYQSAVKEMPYD